MAESNDCQSCKADRSAKGLPPTERIHLPAQVTDNDNFRKPELEVIVCPHCDGETLISTALKAFQARQGD